MTKRSIVLAASLSVLAACNVRDETGAAAGNTTTATTTATTTTTGVTRDEVAVATPVPPPVQDAVIRTQPGPRGNSVSLNRVAVTGDILTVSMTFSGGDNCCIHIPVDDVSVIDDATSQRISVLKDNTGKFMAAPLESGGKNVGPESWRAPSVVWFKFPAPPATSKTVSVTVPGTAPFDAVPVTR